MEYIDVLLFPLDFLLIFWDYDFIQILWLVFFLQFIFMFISRIIRGRF